MGRIIRLAPQRRRLYLGIGGAESPSQSPSSLQLPAGASEPSKQSFPLRFAGSNDGSAHHNYQTDRYQ